MSVIEELGREGIRGNAARTFVNKPALMEKLALEATLEVLCTQQQYLKDNSSNLRQQVNISRRLTQLSLAQIALEHGNIARPSRQKK